MVKVVIFDFDLTLFDSSPIKPLMDKRKWASVNENIHRCSFYPNALNMLQQLKLNNIQTAIVSNAPSSYVKKVLGFYGVKIDMVVCYHDVKQHKPNPEGVYKVLTYFAIKNHEAIYVGDNDLDYKTAINANVDFYGVSWGIYSQEVNFIGKTIIKVPFGNAFVVKT